MPKTWATPQNELVCGKLDVLQRMAKKYEDVEMLELLEDVRHDCERMEQKLISRKDEVVRFVKAWDAIDWDNLGK